MFDAIVVGSGISGGWVAKELTEKGLKVLVLERGRNMEHGADYNDGLMPWELPDEGKIAEEEIAARLSDPVHGVFLQRRQQAFLGQGQREPLFDTGRQALHLVSRLIISADAR